MDVGVYGDCVTDALTMSLNDGNYQSGNVESFGDEVACLTHIASLYHNDKLSIAGNAVLSASSVCNGTVFIEIVNLLFKTFTFL